MSPDDMLFLLMEWQRTDIKMTNRMSFRDLKRLTKYIDVNFFIDQCCFYNCNNPAFYFNGKKVILTRLLYINYIGPLDKTHRIRRLCGETDCVTPGHLEKVLLKKYLD